MLQRNSVYFYRVGYFREKGQVLTELKPLLMFILNIYLT